MTTCKATITEEIKAVLDTFNSKVKIIIEENSATKHKDLIELSNKFLNEYSELDMIGGKWTPLWIKEESIKILNENKKQRGGKRKGAGRPKKEKTELMRIPVSLIKIVTELKAINEMKWEDKEKINEIIMMLKNRSDEEQINLL